MTVICVVMLAALSFLSFKMIKRSFKSRYFGLLNLKKILNSIKFGSRRQKKRRSIHAPGTTSTSLIDNPTRDSEKQIQLPNEEDYTYSVPGYYKCNNPHNIAPSAPKLRQVDILRGIQTAQPSGSIVNPIPKPQRRNNPPGA